MDAYIGIEPVTKLVTKSMLNIPQGYENKVWIYNIALDTLDVPKRQVTFYEDFTPGNHKLGSSLLADKKMRKSEQITVDCVDVNYFFEDTFDSGDEVIMKIDVEGKEYDIFEALILSGNLKKYVTKIYTEWHWNKVESITQERHKNVVFALRELGYPLRGKSKEDEFYNGF